MTLRDEAVRLEVVVQHCQLDEVAVRLELEGDVRKRFGCGQPAALLGERGVPLRRYRASPAPDRGRAVIVALWFEARRGYAEPYRIAAPHQLH